MKSPGAGSEEGGSGDGAPSPFLGGGDELRDDAAIGRLSQRIALWGVVALAVVAILFFLLPPQPQNRRDTVTLAMMAGLGLVVLLEATAFGLGLSALAQRGAVLGVLISGLILLAAAAVAATAFMVR